MIKKSYNKIVYGAGVVLTLSLLCGVVKVNAANNTNARVSNMQQITVNKLNSKNEKILVLDYSLKDYTLLKLSDDPYIYLDKNEKKSDLPLATVLRYNYISNRNFEEETKKQLDEMRKMQDEAKNVKKLKSNEGLNIDVCKSDIDVKSKMIVQTYASNNKVFDKTYFIDDGKDGTFVLNVNLNSNVKSAEDIKKAEAIIKSIKILPKEGSENLMKVKEIDSNFKAKASNYFKEN